MTSAAGANLASVALSMSATKSATDARSTTIASMSMRFRMIVVDGGIERVERGAVFAWER
jgi:nucleoside permease NupC